MKANEAPEKIYISPLPNHSDGYVGVAWDEPHKTMVEYTSTDVFIENACEWLKDNIYHRVYECGDRLGFPTANFIEDFRKYMKGE